MANATIVKSGTGTSLTAGASWDGGAVPGPTDIAQWQSTSLVSGVTGSLSVKGFDIQGGLTSALSLAAQTIDLGGINLPAAANVNLTFTGSTTFNNSQTWTIGSGRTITGSGIVIPASITAAWTLDVAGAYNNATTTWTRGLNADFYITKKGAGTASWTGSALAFNLGAGGLDVLEGTWQWSTGASAPSWTMGYLNVASGALFSAAIQSSSIGYISGAGTIKKVATVASYTLSFGNSLSIDATYSGTFDSNTGSFGTFTKSGTNTQTFSGNSTAWVGSNTISVTGGGLVAAHANALGTSAGAINVSSAAFFGLSGSTYSGTRTVVITSGGQLKLLNGATWSGGAITAPGTGIGSTGAIYSDGGSNSITGAITVPAAGSTYYSDTNGTLTLGGTITLSGILTTAGAGTIILNGATTSTASVIVSSGTLRINAASTKTGAGTWSVNSGGRLIIANNDGLGAAASAIPFTTMATNATISLVGVSIPSNKTIPAMSGTLEGLSGTSTWAGAITLSSLGAKITAVSNATLTVSGTVDPSISSALTYDGAGTIIQSGSITGARASSVVAASTMTGSVTFSVSNSHTGGTTINGGTVRVGNSGALGTGTTTMTGGTLTSDGANAYSFTNALSLSGTVTLGAAATYTGALTFSGTTTITGTTTVSSVVTTTLSGSFRGSAALSMSTGAGAFFLTGTATNDYSGALTISGANVYLASGISGTPNQVNGASSITISSGSLNYLGGTALSQSATQPISGAGTLRVFNNAGVTFNGNMNTVGSNFTGILSTFSDDATGNTTPSITFASASAYPLSALGIDSGSNNTTSTTHTVTYSGNANLSTTQYWGHYAYQTPYTSVVNHNATGNRTWTMSGSVWISNDNAKDVALQYNVATGNTLNISVPFKEFSTGKFSLEKLGTGTMTLSGDNQISKTVTVTAGTLNANSATALGAANSTAAISVMSGATLSLGAALNYSLPGRSTSISGTGVSGVDAGCLVLANTGPLNLGAINATNNTYVRSTVTTQLTSPIAWSGTGGLRLGAATGTTATFSGAISVSSGTLTAILFGRSNNPDLGIVVLGTTNTFAAPAQIDYGTLQISADANLGTAPVATTAAYLIIGGSTTLATTATFTLNANRGIALGPSSGTGTGTINVANLTTLTYAGIIANNSTGTGKLVKSSSGTLKLTGTNTYTGGTDIAGTVQAGATRALGTTGTVTLTSNATTLQTLTTGGQNGKLTVGGLNNSAGGTIKIGG